MNKSNVLEIGDRIEIEAPHFMKEANKKYLVSQIMDKIDEDIYFVAMPIEKNNLVPIPVGEIIKIRCPKDSGIYVFNAEVIGRKNTDNISYMKIQRVEAIHKTQRRNFFRLEILLNVEIGTVDQNTNEPKKITALGKDISGGGLRLICKEQLELQSTVTLTIDTKKSPIIVEGKVIRCIPYQSSDFDVGIIFEDIGEGTRSKIISFIFEEQRKMRKKGLI